MKMHRIMALMVRHLYLYQRSLPRLMDIFYWPVMELLVWGFLSAYLAGQHLSTVNIVTVLLGGIIFWDLLSQAQRTVSIAFLEDVWERNLLNIFVTPLQVNEFMASTILLGIIRIALVGIVVGFVSYIFYSFNILQFGWVLIPFFLNLLLFGWTLGLFTTSLILRFGTYAEVIAFGFIFMIQPFSAVFYPVSALPPAAQAIAYALPSSYIFEGMRTIAAGGAFPSQLFYTGLVMNIIYLAAVVWFFNAMFARIKRKGMLMKLN